MMIEILITGDFIPPNKPSVLSNKELLDFLIDKKLQDEIHKSDISITNLEVPLTNSDITIKKSGPNLKGHPDNIRYLELAGFNMVTLANNHIMDYEAKGLADTLELCQTHKINTIGAGLNKEAAKSTFYLHVKGIKLAIINIAENEFIKSRVSGAQAHGFDLIDVYKGIQAAKEKADYVVIIYHGGVEHFQLPYPEMRKNLSFLAEGGANLIVCHHTHCYSGYEFVGNTPIFYGLGNFYFNRKTTRKTWFEGFILKLFIDANLKTTFKLFPYSQSKNGNGVRLMEGEDLERFFLKIKKLNAILKDTSRYFYEWDAFTKKLESKIINQIYPKGYFSNEKKNLNKHKGTAKLKYLYNLIRTEASNSVLQKILDNLY